MDLKTCTELVQEVARAAGPLSEQSRRQLKINGKAFRVMPDEHFVFPHGHLLVEYERNKRPVESISKYWWLQHKSNWLERGQRFALVLLVDSRVIESRAEAAELLGFELEKRYPETFAFFYAYEPPDGMTASLIRHIVEQALVRVKQKVPWP
ncbi:MAG: hypothetical protein IIC26_05830 [Chloroflexi bacterium]|nr:hypothetical protein [Chloroflexota bacterium]